METYIVCFTHPIKACGQEAFFKSTLLAASDALLLRLRLSKESLLPSIVSAKIPPFNIEKNAYVRVNGTLQFTNPHTKRVCECAVDSDHVCVDSFTACCIARLTDLRWQESTASADEFLSILECRIRVRHLQHRRYVHKERDYVAVKFSDVKEAIVPAIRNALDQCDCLFQVNVSFLSQAGSRTHRSLLVPASLLSTTPLTKPDNVWAILTLGHTPRLMHLSDPAAFAAVCGVEIIPSDSVDFAALLRLIHTPEEVMRITEEVFPVLRAMSSERQFGPMLVHPLHARAPIALKIAKVRSCYVAILLPPTKGTGLLEPIT